MRKSLKKLRYTAEFLAPLYPKNKVEPFVRRLKKLQDVFGYVNDVRMAAELREIAKAHSGEPEPLIAAGLVMGHHEAEAADGVAAGAQSMAPPQGRRAVLEVAARC